MTRWHVRVHPDVINVDLAEAIDHYGKLDPALPDRVVDDFIAGLRRVEAHPTLSREYLEGWRRVLLATFPYLIAYTVDGDVVVVGGLFHSRRDPDFVRSALEARSSDPK